MKGTKRCGRYDGWLALAAGGDLPARLARKLESHVADCSECRALQAEMREAREAFLALDSPPPEAELAFLHTRVMAQVAALQRPAKRLAFWRWLVPAMAGLAAALILAWVTIRPGHQPRPNEPEIARATKQERPRPAAAVPQELEATVAIGPVAVKPAIRRRSRAAASTRFGRQPVEMAGALPPGILAATPVPSTDPEAPAVVRMKTKDPSVVVYWVFSTAEEDSTGEE